jgi:hypothetical protein
MTRSQIAAVSVVVALVAGSTSASASTPDRCVRAHTHTVAKNRLVRVYTVRYPSESERALVTCWRATGRTRTITSATTGDVDPTYSVSFGLVRLRGAYVAFYKDEFEAGCKADCPVGFQADTYTLQVVNAGTKTAKRVISVDARPADGCLLLDAHGAIAWARWLADNQVELHVRDANGERVVDSGAIRPEDVTLTAGGTLRWWRAHTENRMLQLTH